MHEWEGAIQAILSCPDLDSHSELVLPQLKVLRNSCAAGREIQEHIARNENFQQFLLNLLSITNDSKKEQLQLMAWQLVANIIVNNPLTQKIVLSKIGRVLIQKLEEEALGKTTEVQLMILYNVFKGGTQMFDKTQLLNSNILVWQSIVKEKCDLDFEFLHFFFEYFIVEDGASTAANYIRLEVNGRIVFLDYLVHYLQQNSPNGLVHKALLNQISKQFKEKSDYVLCVSTARDMEQLQPREAYGLLRVIASASGCAKYGAFYQQDNSLFLNVSSLLRCLIATGKQSSVGIHVPLSKLEQVAPSSNMACDFEREVSFELKTLLVRCIANLLFENQTNQKYCADTQLMPALLECTNMDARNPLMKEWSILAIRNACVGCSENQSIIEQLVKLAPLQNNVISELNLEMGSLRIGPS